VSQDHQTKPF